jgi:hypothetical protein
MVRLITLNPQPETFYLPSHPVILVMGGLEAIASEFRCLEMVDT